MYKQALRLSFYLVFVLIVATGCSSSRKSKTIDVANGEGISKSYAYSDIFESNLSAHGFFIRKLRLIIDFGGTRESYTANLRKSMDGKWLVSVQLLRIEVLRVYADSENVVVLDRIGRKAVVLGWERLKSEYGITYDLLPLIVGDVPEVTRQSQKEVNCKVPTQFRVGNFKYDLIADCVVPRAKEVVLNVEPGSRIIEMKAEEFRSAEEIFYSSVISVKERSGAFSVEMLIDEMQIPWDGQIDFSIPTNYRVERK